MRRLKIAALLCFAAALAVMALTGCSSSQGANAPEGKEPTVSSPVIGKDGTLRVGVNANNAPLAGQPSGTSKVVGIDVDVASAIADDLGLKIEIVDMGTDAQTALDEGRVDIAMGIDSSNGDVTCWKSDSYLPTAIALFGKEDTKAPKVNSKPSIAAQTSSTSAWAVSNLFGDAAMTSADSLESAFGSLEKGEVKYVAADAVVGLYAAHSTDANAKIIALLQAPTGYCVGISSSNTELRKAVKKSLKSVVEDGMMEAIELKWLGADVDFSKVKQYDSSDSAAKSEEKKTTKEEKEALDALASEGNGSSSDSSDSSGNDNSGSSDASASDTAASDSTDAAAQDAAATDSSDTVDAGSDDGSGDVSADASSADDSVDSTNQQQA